MEYRDLNHAEIASIVSFAITFNCEKARRLFIEKFDKEPPSARTLLEWKNRFLETLLFLPRNHTSDQSDKRISSEKRAEWSKHLVMIHIPRREKLLNNVPYRYLLLTEF